MIDLIRDHSLIPPWQRAAVDGDVDFDAMFAGFESTIDWPGCTYWRELMEYYPDAPVLYNVRDFDGWYKSFKNTIWAVRLAAQAGTLDGGGTENPPPPELWQVIGKLIYEVDFQGHDPEDEAWMRQNYERRYEEVMSTVPEDRLVVFKLEDDPGWGPLCEALGVDEPDEPFPHLHDTNEFRAEFGLPAV